MDNYTFVILDFILHRWNVYTKQESSRKLFFI